MTLTGFDVFNTRLLKEPMNWAIVFIVASVWLLLFHTIMQAWGAMTAPVGQAAFGAPGAIASPLPDVTATFSGAGLLAGSYTQTSADRFIGSGMSSWTDGSESKYAEDGWVVD